MDFHNFTDILFDLKLSPDDLKVPIPKFFTEDRTDELETRRTLLDSLNAKPFSLERPPLFNEIKLFDAIKMIQVSERGRQGQLRAKYMKDIRSQAKREDMIDGEDDELEVNKASLVIQSVFRGFVARKLYRKMKNDEVIFLGMELAPRNPHDNPTIKREENEKYRRQLRKQHELEYHQALISTKEKILKVEGPDMKEGIQDSFRQWYMESKRTEGKLPDFPADEVWQQSNFSFSNQEVTAGDETKDSSKDLSKKDAKKDGKKGEEGTEDAYAFGNTEFIANVKST